MTQVVSINPASGEHRTLDVDETGPEAVRELCARAARAAPDVAARTIAWRSSLLRAIADELEADLANLVEAALYETALPRPRLEGEVRRTVFQWRFFADVVDDGAFLQVSIDHPVDSPMGALPDLRRFRVPLGPVAVFGSSNFPFAFSVPGGDSASALAAGCPIVIKAHPAHPATGAACFAAMVRGARRVDAPEGLLALVFGFAAGEAIVDDPAITAVGFTGSVPAGRALWRRAYERSVPIPFYGELGAANPLVVTPSAATERAQEIATGLAASLTLGVGQFCTKPGLLFVPNGPSGDALTSSLTSALEAIAPATMLSSSIAANFERGAATIANVEGASRLVAGDVEGARAGAQLYEVAATTFSGPAGDALREECFGPLAIVVRYDHDELPHALASADPALTFSVFSTDDDEDAAWLLDYASTRAGRVIVNGYPTGVGVSWSMQHGGPWPSTTAASATSVGAGAIDRWLRPVTYQSVPADLLPPPLRDDNPWGVPQRVDGH